MCRYLQGCSVSAPSHLREPKLMTVFTATLDREPVPAAERADLA
ncbi:hypothetical protein ACGF0D_37065 [Kitasatospora sp. NPDC048298]